MGIGLEIGLLFGVWIGILFIVSDVAKIRESLEDKND